MTKVFTIFNNFFFNKLFFAQFNEEIVKIYCGALFFIVKYNDIDKFLLPRIGCERNVTSSEVNCENT